MLRDALDDYLASQRLGNEAQTKDVETAKDREPETAEAKAEAVQELEQKSAAAKQDETAELVRADSTEAETKLDAKHTQADEAKEATPRHDDPSDRPANEVSAAPARVLAVWKEKGGKDADFPKAPTTFNTHSAMKNRKKVVAAVGTQRGQS